MRFKTKLNKTRHHQGTDKIVLPNNLYVCEEGDIDIVHIDSHIEEGALLDSSFLANEVGDKG